MSESLAAKFATDLEVTEGASSTSSRLVIPMPEGANGVALATMTSAGLQLHPRILLPHQVTIELVAALIKKPSWGKAEVWAIPTRSVERFLVAKAL